VDPFLKMRQEAMLLVKRFISDAVSTAEEGFEGRGRQGSVVLLEVATPIQYSRSAPVWIAEVAE
jgi:hypothetical protein